MQTNEFPPETISGESSGFICSRKCNLLSKELIKYGILKLNRTGIRKNEEISIPEKHNPNSPGHVPQIVTGVSGDIYLLQESTSSHCSSVPQR